MKTLVSTVILFSLLTTQAYAVCEDSNIIFFCHTKKGKQITVCDEGKTIEYSFGKADKPEIALKIPREMASTYQWIGMGSTISYSVNIPNGDAQYNVFWNADRNVGDHPIDAGVNVFIKDDLKTTVQCSEKGLISNMEGVNLKPAE